MLETPKSLTDNQKPSLEQKNNFQISSQKSQKIQEYDTGRTEMPQGCQMELTQAHFEQNQLNFEDILAEKISSPVFDKMINFENIFNNSHEFTNDSPIIAPYSPLSYIWSTWMCAAKQCAQHTGAARY